MDGKEPETDRVDWGQPGRALGDSLKILAAENWELADVFMQRKDFISFAFSDRAGGGSLVAGRRVGGARGGGANRRHWRLELVGDPV